MLEMSRYIYVCAGGETFDSIAQDMWQDEKYAAELMCANPEYCTKTFFTGGEELYLPVIEPPEDDMGAASEPEKAPWKED